MLSATSSHPPSRPAVIGGAVLGYESGSEGRTRLTKQWVRPPLHMGKAYHEGGWAINQLMSPTAGLLSGDVLEVEAEIQEGAKAALISPAACRVHTMDEACATIRQKYWVGAGAVLDVWPAPLILQRGARLKQETLLNISASATVLMCETISPGRAAYGERFEFDLWASSLRIYRENTLLAFENFELFPQRGDAQDWRAVYPDGNYASIYLLTPEPLTDVIQTLHDLNFENAMLGASPLRDGGIGVKILAKDGISLRKIVFSVRNLLVNNANVAFPSALKRAQTFFH